MAPFASTARPHVGVIAGLRVDAALADRPFVETSGAAVRLEDLGFQHTNKGQIPVTLVVI
jgi:hypothetical protein